MADSMRTERHRFSPETLTAVREASRLDNWHGPLEIALHWGWIAVWCALTVIAFRHAPIPVAVLVNIVAVFFIGGRQRALAGVLHMSTHRAFMANRRAGDVVGALFGGYPVLQTFTGYRSSHVGDHHGHLGDAARDPDYRQYVKYGLCGDDLDQSALRHYLRAVITPRSTASYIMYLVRHRILASDERPVERRLRVGLLAGVIVWSTLGGWLTWLLVLWFVPLVTTQVWIGSVAELLEHYPVIETAPRLDIRMSWNRDYHLVNRFLLGEKDGEGFHLAHHLFPRTPMWRLREVDRILQGDPEYRALSRLGGPVAGIKQVYSMLPRSTATSSTDG